MVSETHTKMRFGAQSSSKETEAGLGLAEFTILHALVARESVVLVVFTASTTTNASAVAKQIHDKITGSSDPTLKITTFSISSAPTALLFLLLCVSDLRNFKYLKIDKIYQLQEQHVLQRVSPKRK